MKKGLYFINTLQMAVRYIYSAARRCCAFCFESSSAFSPLRRSAITLAVVPFHSVLPP